MASDKAEIAEMQTRYIGTPLHPSRWHRRPERQKCRWRFKSVRLPAAAAVPRSAAGCRRTGFSERRPRQPIGVA